MTQVFTDGSCYHGDRIGGWAWVAPWAEDNEELLWGGGSAVDTTISRMELMGPIDALETLYARYGAIKVDVFSDSEYVVKGMQYPSRNRNLNVDLWDWLEDVVSYHTKISWFHVRGHQGHIHNEMADDIAGQFRKARQRDERS